MDHKKELILNCIQLGMDFFTSALSVSCTKDEMEALEQDDEFQQHIRIKQAILEKDLLMSHDAVCDIQAEKGTASAIQWKLERTNPDRWGSRTKIESDDFKNIPLEIVRTRGGAPTEGKKS